MEEYLKISVTAQKVNCQIRFTQITNINQYQHLNIVQRVIIKHKQGYKFIMNLNKASLNIVKCQNSQMRRTQLIFCYGIIPGQNQPDILRHDYTDHLPQWRGPQFVFMGHILIFISAFSDYKIYDSTISKFIQFIDILHQYCL